MKTNDVDILEEKVVKSAFDRFMHNDDWAK